MNGCVWDGVSIALAEKQRIKFCTSLRLLRGMSGCASSAAARGRPRLQHRGSNDKRNGIGVTNVVGGMF